MRFRNTSFQLSLAVVGLLFSFNASFAQFDPLPEADKPAVKSPEAAVLGKFGDIPVSLFNGSVEVAVPVTSLAVGNIQIPISLSYDASGCRPDTHPGWVGLNWALSAGGVINRQANGYNDDRFEGYVTNYSDMNSANWLDVDRYFPMVGFHDPDEFKFNVNGLTGSFLLNHEGKWVVKCKEDPNIKVTHVYSDNYRLPALDADGDFERIKTFTGFTMTTSDGTKYTFGGVPSAIEFSFPSLPNSREPYNGGQGPLGPERAIRYCMGTTPHRRCEQVTMNIQSSAWRLTKIESPTGGSASFYYDQSLTESFSTFTRIGETAAPSPSTSYDINVSDTYVLHTSYLNRIELDNGVSCKLYKSLTNELPVTLKGRPESRHNTGVYLYNSTECQYFKLDSLEVNVNGAIAKKITFGYIDNPSERLKLTRVRIHPINTRQSSHEYGMAYNPKKLPAYSAGMEDHWGYYNGRSFWGTTTGQFVTPKPNVASFKAVREADPTKMDAEILTEIKYPTGGSTKFFYEAHDYAKVIVQNPSMALSVLSANKIAGGLRIQRVETYDKQSTVPIVKEYFYKTSYLGGGQLSSGILAGEPQYRDIVNTGYGMTDVFSSIPLNQLNTTNGNHVTYTEVTEKRNDGYVVYHYTNHDNGYLDKDAFAAKATSVFSAMNYKLFGSLALERGQIKTETYYTAAKVPVKKIENVYNDNPARYNSYVRVCQMSGGVYPYNLFLYPIYTFVPYLKSSVTTEYVNGNVAMTTVAEYEYESTYNLNRRTTMSKSNGTVIKQVYKYPFDILGSSTANEAGVNNVRQLVTNNIISRPLEVITIDQIGGQNHVVAGKLTLFKDLLPEKELTASITTPIPEAGFKEAYADNTQLRIDPTYEEFLKIGKRDEYGNVMEAVGRDGIATTYLWGYKGGYPVAKIVNATYVEVEAVLGSSVVNTLKQYNSQDYIVTQIERLRSGIPTAQVYTYIYRPLVGMTGQVDPNGIKTSFEYDNLGRLLNVRNNTDHLLRKYDYGYYEEKTMTFSSLTVDFGTVVRNSVTYAETEVTNTGNQEIVITGVQGALAVYSFVDRVVVPSGVTRAVRFRFAPTIPAQYNQTVTLLTTAGNISLNLRGVCDYSRIMSLNETKMSFGAQVARPVTSAFWITNSGDGVMTIYGIDTPAGFSIVDWNQGTIAPGQMQMVTIRFNPPQAGPYSGTLVVRSDKTSGTSTIALTGVGEPRH